MKLTAAPNELVALFNAVLPVNQQHTIEPRKMFGYPCAFTGGHMFMGLFQDQMMLRLSPDDRAELIGKGGAVFEPAPGKPMNEYVTVPPSVLENQAALRDWVHRSLIYVSSLPPKPKSEPPKGASSDGAA
jgi:TfoX/Sxy family transcriptional regulator of competence genes